MRKLQRLSMLAVSFSMAAMCAVPEAFAQQGNGIELEEVTVTARRRDENLLDIPLTITVLTADDIAVKGIAELDDIVDYSPGFFYGGPSVGANARTNRRLIIRGMQVNTDGQTLQGTTLFIDGAAVLGAEVGSLSGVERVEIIKGPQSAYFGRSTFAGAVNFITRNPGQKWTGTAKATAAQFGTSDYGLEIEGPLVKDKLSMRVSGSRYQTDGQYYNAATSAKLGARETRDVQATLYFTPTERFSAKLRLHYWEDEDGPSSSFAFGLRNGVDVFNCNLAPGVAGTASNISGGALTGPSGTNNWVCGIPRFPTAAEIKYDTAVTPDLQLRLDNAAPGQQFFLGPRLKGYGLYREAQEFSLALNYTFQNGITIDTLSATHGNKHRSVDDFDRRVTADLGLAFNTIGVGDTKREDVSHELRIASSGEQKLRWLVGASHSEVEASGVGASRSTTGIWTNSINGVSFNKVETSGIFGSLAYDIGEKFTVSVEGRSQKDKVSDGSDLGILCPVASTTNCGPVPPGGKIITGTFKSTTPRVILDYKPAEDITFYGIYAEGTRPGTFNSALLTVPPSMLTCIAAAVGADIEIPEEDLTNYEIGFKGRLWGGRGSLTAAIYYGEWRHQQNRGLAPCFDPRVNAITSTATTGSGGSTDLSGVEVEFNFAVTEKLNLESSFAYNKTDILRRDCADCLIILGFREIAGLHKEFSRTPKYSAVISGNYQSKLTDATDWFVRTDYLFRASTWATDANITETGDSHRFNLRGGIQRGGLRLELYVTNLFDSKTFTGYQRLTDTAFQRTGFSPSILSAGLPDKREIGLRTNYKWDW